MVSADNSESVRRADSRRLRIAVAQIGARRHYAIPAILHRAGLLEAVFTDAAGNTTALRLVDRCVPASLQPTPLKRLLARRIDGVPSGRIVTFPMFALSRAWERQRVLAPGAIRQMYVRRNSQFGRLVVRRGLGESNAAYVFNGAALEILQHARDRGLNTILEQTSAPVAVEEAILSEERERWPDWEGASISREEWLPMADREKAEWQLADKITCGSVFVAEGIEKEKGPSERCTVVPYGVSDTFFLAARETPRQRPLRVLFVGAIRLQKGIQYLMQAARLLYGKPFEFRAVGPIRVSDGAVAQLREALEVIGPVPRSQIMDYYGWADVLVFPSLCEGSANVCYEALAAGVPVITTPNAGSVVRDGIDGFVVPPRSAQAIVDRLVTVESDRDLLRQLSENAVQRARQFTWEQYAARIINAIQERRHSMPSVAGTESSSPRVDPSSATC